MSKQTVVKATEGHREFGKLLRRVYGSDEHLVVERDGFPVAVILSYQEYQELTREQSLAHLEHLNRALSKEAEA
jgi:prevent-host-death family protein